MKALVALFQLILLAGPLTSFCQATSLRGKLVDRQSHQGIVGALLVFKRTDTIVTRCISDSAGLFQVDNLPPDVYKLDIAASGYRPQTLQNVLVSATTAPLIITFPGPCPYAYSGAQPVTCKFGHTDQLIPVVYGEPSDETVEKARWGKVYLGGCIVTGCDPTYYCKIHHLWL